jgi:Synaptobrevin
VRIVQSTVCSTQQTALLQAKVAALIGVAANSLHLHIHAPMLPPASAVAHRPIIQRQMAYCAEHPEEVSKMAAVQRKVDEVKSIMMQNVEQVLVRGERLDVLVDRTDDLRDQVRARACVCVCACV